MIKLPTEKELKEKKWRWAKIHEILKVDAKKQLKDNILLTADEKKLLAWLLEQKEWIGRIGLWMPTKEAREKLLTLGLVEDNLVLGGFRDWLADKVKTLIQNNEIPTVLKLLSDFDPASVVDIDDILKKNENVFYKHHDTWIVQFQKNGFK